MDIYFIAIGGTGMAPLACLLQEQGHQVRGSDGPLYSPMSDLLASAGIEPLVGFDPSHLDPAPDLVIVGNAVHRDQVEAREAERLGLPLTSMPAALARFFLEGRKPLVVAGTHGKTTISSMAAWVYSECGQDPGYLIGGKPIDLPTSFRAGNGDRFVIEGDEYNAAYFDRGPKFLHYQAETVILTGAEYDHVDLYPTERAFRAAFERLIEKLPSEGRLIACWDALDVRSLAEHAPCNVVFYSIDPRAPVGTRPDEQPAVVDGSTRFSVVEGGSSAAAESSTGLELKVFGSHNVSNALAVWCAARGDGLGREAVAAALSRFRGVRRRLEESGRAGGAVVVDDFAHHPTEVGKSIEGLRARYPDRRVIVLYEPRSLTAGRSMFYDAYLDVFSGADRVILAPVFHAGRLTEDELLDLRAVADALSAQGTPATACDSVEEVFELARKELGEGDVVATMSSGAFEGMPRRLLDSLGAPSLARKMMSIISPS